MWYKSLQEKRLFSFSSVSSPETEKFFASKKAFDRCTILKIVFDQDFPRKIPPTKNAKKHSASNNNQGVHLKENHNLHFSTINLKKKLLKIEIKL